MTAPDGRAREDSADMSDEKKVRPTSALAGKIAGFDICRRAIYRTPIGRESWANDMLKAMAACKMLGVQTFEVDVRYDPEAPRPQGQKKQDAGDYRISIFSMFRDPAEDWQTTPEPEQKPTGKGADILTLYAVVVE